MFRELFLFLFILLNVLSPYNSVEAAPPAKNEVALGKVLKKVVPAVANAGTIDYKSGCSTCSQYELQADKKPAILFSKDNDQKIELTAISEDEAASLFSELSSRKDIPFGYPMDGCYARAHKMVRILEDHGVIAGKAFVEGELYVDTKFGEVGWGYHVAPVVMVKKGNSLIPYVFDPSLFPKPVPQTEWKAKMMTKSKSKLTREYYTNRFAYDPEDRTKKYSDYSEESLEDMEDTNHNFSRMLYMYNASKKK